MGGERERGQGWKLRRADLASRPPQKALSTAKVSTPLSILSTTWSPSTCLFLPLVGTACQVSSSQFPPLPYLFLSPQFRSPLNLPPATPSPPKRAARGRYSC